MKKQNQDAEKGARRVRTISPPVEAPEFTNVNIRMPTSIYWEFKSLSLESGLSATAIIVDALHDHLMQLGGVYSEMETHSPSYKPKMRKPKHGRKSTESQSARKARPQKIKARKRRDSDGTAEGV